MFSIIEGNQGSLKVAMGFHNILNKSVDEIINKLESSQYKGSKLWELFKASGSQAPKPNVPDHMSYYGNAERISSKNLECNKLTFKLFFLYNNK